MKAVVAAVLLSTAAGSAFAQQPQMNMGSAEAGNMPPYARENKEAMDRMQGPMMDAMKAPDEDRAFVQGMIPHHQGAVDMARVALKYAKDPQVRKWSRRTIREQGKEKVEFEAWLRKHAR